MQEFSITSVPAQKTFSVTLEATKDSFKNLFPEWLPKVWVAAQSAGIAGPSFARYHQFDDKKVILEIGVPISGDAESQGEMKQSELPASRVAKIKYTGPYEGLHEAWAELGKQVADGGYEANGAFWESYVTDPREVPDPNNWVTELYAPIK